MYHPAVMKLVHEKAVGYEEAEAVLRSRKDAESVRAVREIDGEAGRERARAGATFRDMCAKLGLDRQAVRKLIVTVAENPAVETWLLRRVNLTRAHGAAPADDEHPENA